MYRRDVADVITLSPPSAGADAYPAIQDALGMDAVYLNAGIYLCTKPPVLPALAPSITGEGSYRSVIQVRAPGPGIMGTDVARLTLRGVGITGAGKAAGSAAGIELARSASPNTFGLNFDDVVVQQFGGNGVALSNPIVSRLTGVIAENCGQCGFYLSGVIGGASGTSTVLSACYGNACGLAGYYIDTMTYIQLAGCAADGNAAGYVIERSQGVVLSACGAEGTVAGGVGLMADGTSFRVDASSAVSLDDCWCYGNPAVTTHISGGSTRIRVRVKDNSPAASAVAALVVDTGSEIE